MLTGAPRCLELLPAPSPICPALPPWHDQAAASLPPGPPPRNAQVPSQFQGPGRNERVRCYAVAESFERYALQDAILRREGSLQAYAEVLISEFHRTGEDT